MIIFIHLIYILLNVEKIHNFDHKNINETLHFNDRIPTASTSLFSQIKRKSHLLNCPIQYNFPQQYIINFQKKIAPFYFISRRIVISYNITFFKIKCIYSSVEQDFYVNENSQESFNLMYNKIPNILISLNDKLNKEIPCNSILKYIIESNNELIFYNMLNIIIKDLSNTLKIVKTFTSIYIAEFNNNIAICNVPYIYISFKKYCEDLLNRNDILNILDINDKIKELKINYFICSNIDYKCGLSQCTEKNINFRIRKFRNNMLKKYQNLNYMFYFLYGLYRKNENNIIKLIGIFSIGNLWNEINEKIDLHKINLVIIYLKIFMNISYNKFYNKKEKIRNIFKATHRNKLYCEKVSNYFLKKSNKIRNESSYSHRTLINYFNNIYDDIVVGVSPYAKMKLYFLVISRENLNPNRDLILLESDIILLTLIFELYTLVSKIKSRLINLEY